MDLPTSPNSRRLSSLFGGSPKYEDMSSVKAPRLVRPESTFTSRGTMLVGSSTAWTKSFKQVTHATFFPSSASFTSCVCFCACACVCLCLCVCLSLSVLHERDGLRVFNPLQTKPVGVPKADPEEVTYTAVDDDDIEIEKDSLVSLHLILILFFWTIFV